LQQLRRDTGKEFVVVTITSIDQYTTNDQTIESFATHLFNTWSLGDRQRNDGVMLLVAVNDRRVRIELGAGYPHSADADMAAVIDTAILPNFKRGDYSQGIVQGVQGVIGKLTGRPPAAPPASLSPSGEHVPDVAPASATSGTSALAASSQPAIPPLVGLGGAAGALGAAALGIRQYVRHRKRRCPNCQMMMQRLDDAASEVYLDSGQKLEEHLGSIHYNVLKCPSCGMHTLLSHPRRLSGYPPVPKLRLSYTPGRFADDRRGILQLDRQPARQPRLQPVPLPQRRDRDLAAVD
jgi:uncharacterized protein